MTVEVIMNKYDRGWRWAQSVVRRIESERRRYSLAWGAVIGLMGAFALHQVLRFIFRP